MQVGFFRWFLWLQLWHIISDNLIWNFVTRYLYIKVLEVTLKKLTWALLHIGLIYIYIVMRWKLPVLLSATTFLLWIWIWTGMETSETSEVTCFSEGEGIICCVVCHQVNEINKIKKCFSFSQVRLGKHWTSWSTLLSFQKDIFQYI